jgi:hypothetical protein
MVSSHVDAAAFAEGTAAEREWKEPDRISYGKDAPEFVEGLFVLEKFSLQCP